MSACDLWQVRDAHYRGYSILIGLMECAMGSKPAFLAALLIGMAVGTPAFGGEEKNTRLEKLGEEYVAAQFAFDQEAIKRLTTPNFVEISPKG